MKFKNLNKIIVLIALILTSLVSLIQDLTMMHFAIIIGIVFIVFYVLGTIIQNFINKLICQADEAKRKEAEQEKSPPQT
ncbi:MAG: hypothetical protein JW708_10590 [Vallitaleaceae bacterium]|nr:hypothetical protein [Vallitaleaceae bacterium]